MTSLALAFDVLARDKNTAKTFDKIGGSAEGAGKKVKVAGLAIAAGFVAASAAAVKFGASSIHAFKDAAAEVKGLQRVTGGSVENVSRLAFAVKQSGVQSDVFAGAMRKLSTGLVAADKSTTKLVKSYHYEIKAMPKLVDGHIKYVKRLVKVVDVQKVAVKATNAFGFATRDAHGKIIPTSVALEKLADRFQKMPDGAEKTALAIKLFGRQGTAMLPFLNKGAAGIRELEKQSDKLGNTLRGSDLDAIKKNAEAHKRLNAAMQGLRIQVGRLLMPAMATFATFMANRLVPIIGRVGTVITTKVAPAVSDFLKGMRGGTKKTVFARLGADADVLRDRVTAAFKVARAQVSAFFDGFAGKRLPSVKVPGAGRRGESLKADMGGGAATTIGAKARVVFEELRDTIQAEVIPAVKLLVSTIADLGVTMAKKLFPILRDVVGKLFDARAVVIPLAAAFIAVNAAIDVTSNVLDTVKGVIGGYKDAVAAAIKVKAFFVTTTNAETGAVTLSTVAQIRAKVAMIASKVATIAATAATKIYTAVQWLCTAAVARAAVLMPTLAAGEVAVGTAATGAAVGVRGLGAAFATATGPALLFAAALLNVKQNLPEKYKSFTEDPDVRARFGLSPLPVAESRGYTSYGGLKMAGGGYVRGPGSSTSDSVPARLSNGEFVMSAAVTRRNRAALEAINSGKSVSPPDSQPLEITQINHGVTAHEANRLLARELTLAVNGF